MTSMNVCRIFFVLTGFLLLDACSVKHDDKNKLPNMNQAGVIEIVIYQTNPGVNDKKHLVKAASMTLVLSKFNGFISRQFGKNTDGKWVDLVYWKDLSSAKFAANSVAGIPECQAFFSDIDAKKMEFMHSIVKYRYP